MSEEFNGYHKWLGIVGEARVPTHYQLLGIRPNETDPAVIRATAEQRRKFVSDQRGLGHDDVVTKVLYQISEAEATLLDSSLRRRYDEELNEAKQSQSKKKKRKVAGFLNDIPEVPRVHTVGEDTGVIKQFAMITAIIVVAFGLMAWFSYRMSSSEGGKASVETATTKVIVIQVDKAGNAGPAAVPAGAPPVASADGGGASAELGNAASFPESAQTSATTTADAAGPSVESTPAAKLAEPLPPLVDTKGWKRMLLAGGSGRSLNNHWTTDGPGDPSKVWALREGTVRGLSQGPNLVTKLKYARFDLRLEFKLPAKCDTGIQWGAHEVKLVDTAAGTAETSPPQTKPVQARDTKTSATKSEADAKGSQDGPLDVLDEAYLGTLKWNHLRMVVGDGRMSVWLNEQLVVDRQALQADLAGSDSKSDLAVVGVKPGATAEPQHAIRIQSSPVAGAEFRQISIASPVKR